MEVLETTGYDSVAFCRRGETKGSFGEKLFFFKAWIGHLGPLGHLRAVPVFRSQSKRNTLGCLTLHLFTPSPANSQPCAASTRPQRNRLSNSWFLRACVASYAFNERWSKRLSLILQLRSRWEAALHVCMYICMALQAATHGAVVEALKSALSTIVLHRCWTQFVAQFLMSGHFLLPCKTE